MKTQLSEMSLEELWVLFPIILKPYSEAYKEWYQIEEEKLIKALNQYRTKRINHIGSTAVEGLISKPTIDILLEVPKDSNLKDIRSILNDLGWTEMASYHEGLDDMKISFNKGYTINGFADKVYHLHVKHRGDWDELYFRDYLIAHENVKKAYGALKMSLLDQYKNDRDGYTSAKTEFIKKYSEEAKKAYEGRYCCL